MSEWQIEMGNEWDELSRKAKAHALDCAIEEAQYEVNRLTNGLAVFADSETRKFLQAELSIEKIKLTKLKNRRDKFNEKIVEDISSLMIENAKNYPIDQLVEVKHGKARCVNHSPDNHPSMGIKNNYAFCFVCGFHGDAIDVYIKQANCSFVDAVKALQ